MTRQLDSAEATRQLGIELAQGLQAGDIIALHGDLGAGKTTLTQGIARGLHSQAAVTSPSFPLLQEYNDGDLPIAHFDWYRLESEEELWNLGWEEFIDYPGVVIVEWPERFPEALPEETKHWQLSHQVNQASEGASRGARTFLSTKVNS